VSDHVDSSPIENRPRSVVDVNVESDDELSSDSHDALDDEDFNGTDRVQDDAENNASVSGVVSTYLFGLKEKIAREIKYEKIPLCYQQGQFWVWPRASYFAMQRTLSSADGLNPKPLYHPPVFVWLPHLLHDESLLCKNSACIYFNKKVHVLTVKGWNDNPIACHVVALDHVYYVMTQRVHCLATNGGCGKSWNLYDPIIMEQLDPGLASQFPAFLTHRSGVDKTVMALIRAGMAHSLNSSAWSNIFQELHVREHDLQELDYLHAIHAENKKREAHNIVEKAYEPFSAFKDKTGYAGFYPSKWYINTVYMDYMEHIRPVLDQCMASLTGYVLKWDHSFKVPKYLMKLDGAVTFAALFTIVNEFEQIRFQAFVPTKSLSHI
jgi:hypothetical protein